MSAPRRVVVLANDVVPGMGLAVAAPGLRAWGLALGLRAHGHDVTVVLDQRAVRRAWRGQVSPPLPPGCLILKSSTLHRYVRAHDVDALVVTNSNHVGLLGDLGRCRLIYDFFAPKVLEMSQETGAVDLEESLEALATRKRQALARSDAVVVNGAKKLPYVRRWLDEAGVPDLPVEVVTMALPPAPAEPATGARGDRPLRAIITGYLQPWSRPGPVEGPLTALLDRGALTLDLLVGEHWGSGKAAEVHPELQALTSRPGVTRHGLLRFDDFRRLLARCDLSIDVFSRNPERELAMVTRSVVALSCGVPVMHVPFTEVSPLIEEHDAGWLVEPGDVDAMTEVLVQAQDPAVLARKRAGAERVAREVLDPPVATLPLVALLERLA